MACCAACSTMSDISHQQGVWLHFVALDPESVCAQHAYMQQAVATLVKRFNNSQGSERKEVRGSADLMSDAYRYDAEWSGRAQRGADHVEIARFKDPQWQQCAWEQHRLQWKQRCGRSGACHVVHVSCSRALNSRACTSSNAPLLITSMASPARAHLVTAATSAALSVNSS